MAVAERRSLSIVLPCFNESATVEAVVRRAVDVGRSATDRLDVVVVDDGSTDDTASKLARLASDLPEVELVTLGVNAGYGAALRAGLGAARGELLFYTDADGQFDLAELPRLLSLLDRFDVVTGYRLVRRDGPLRRAYGAAWTALTDLLLDTGVRDVNCAFKVFPRSLVEVGDLKSTGALFGAELLSEARRRGLRIGEIGVNHFPRRVGRPTGAYPSVIGRAFRELFALVQDRSLTAPRESTVSAPAAR
jgi:glycosyltransferase involved in cell wall biosynthesis